MISLCPALVKNRKSPFTLVAYRPFAAVGTLCALAALGLAPLPHAHAAPSLAIYLSKPQSQTTIYDLTTVETFESLATGNRTTDFSSAIGTYTLSASNPFNIQADNQYGAGTGQYMAIGAQSGTTTPITLTFAAPQAYFGFSWNAGDNSNGLTFYNGATSLGRFSTATLTTLLSRPTVTAIDGTNYASSEYYGKSGTGATKTARTNNGEPYAFLNFIATGETFDRVVFDNSNSKGSGFESDNHTIRTDAPPTLDQKSVFAASLTNGTTTIATAAPEPAALVYLLPFIPFTGAVGALRRRKRRQS